MTKRRRRVNQSDWLLVLQQSRIAKRLRGNFPSSSGNPQAVSTDSNHSIRDHPPDLNILDHSDSVARIASTVERNADQVADRDSDLFDEEDVEETRNVRETNENAEDVFQPFQKHESWQTPPEIPTTVIDTPLQRFSHDIPTSNPSVGIERQLNTDSLCHSRHTSNTENRRADIATLRERRAIWENHLTLSALVAIVGSVRYTVGQYEFTRSILEDLLPASTLSWPPYSRTQRYFSHIISSCFPESHVVRLPKTGKRTNGGVSNRDTEYESWHLEGTTMQTSPSVDEHASDDTEKVRIFLPSSWAKLDVATSVVFNYMYPTSNATYTNTVTNLDYSAIVQDRGSVTSVCDHIFIEHGDHTVPCGPGSLISINVQRRMPRFRTTYNVSSTDSKYCVTATIAATWSVGAPGHSTPSFRRAIALDSLTSYQRDVLSSLATARPHANSTVSRNGNDCFALECILPGDLCTLLSSENPIQDNEPLVVVVHRFWRYEEGVPSILVVWVRTEICSNGSVMIEFAACHVVKHMKLLRQSSSHQRNSTQGLSRSRGRLENGMPFVVYRILLYCDDFQKSSQGYPNGSAGGCYFLPLSLPPESRRSTSSVRIISLTPPGVSTNNVLHYIVNDLVHASVCGVNGSTPSGETVKIFLDVVGFVGDYPASAGAVDVIGHIGRTPCTLCSFRRMRESETEGSKFGYTTSVHAGNSTFLRHAERHLSLRRCDISDRDTNILGMVNNSRADNRSCPLLHLYKLLQPRQAQIPRTDRGTMVVPGSFDPYRCNLVAPDHLLTGLSKDILNTVFECLPNEDLRFQVDVYICAALRENGLLPQREAFNMQKRVLHSMTLSELFCVMLVAVPIMRVLTCNYPRTHIVRDAVALLTELQYLISLTYWWPQRDLDGQSSESLVSSDVYLRELKTRSKDYVEAVDSFCTRSIGKKIYLDKPNLHRLIELYEHTIPMFGHVREFMELVFESAHQPLKRCISRSNNHDAHLFAVEHCVGNDWQGRIASLSREASHENPLTRPTARRGLRRLLLGAEADLLDETRDKVFITETDLVLQKLLTPGLRRHFNKDSMISNFARPKGSLWTARGNITLTDLTRTVGIATVSLQKVLRMAIELLEAVYPSKAVDENGTEDRAIALYRTARRVKITDAGRQIGRASGFETLSTNCCVQAFVTENNRSDKLVESKVSPGAKPVFFIVFAVLHRKHDLVWALCMRCSQTDDWIQTIGEHDEDSFQILCLEQHVRRVAVYHICQEDGKPNNCNIDREKKQVTHSRLPLKGARMYFQTRLKGYPPRQA